MSIPADPSQALTADVLRRSAGMQVSVAGLKVNDLGLRGSFLTKLVCTPENSMILLAAGKAIADPCFCKPPEVANKRLLSSGLCEFWSV